MIPGPKTFPFCIALVISGCAKDELLSDYGNPYELSFNGSQSIIITNNSTEEKAFEIIINNRRFYTSSEDIVRDASISYGDVRDETGLTAIRSVWLNTAAKVVHNSPFSPLRWQHNPILFLNSIGNGLCDDVANVNEALWRYMNYPARTWYLDGHVVSEVYQGEKWKMFDSDLGFFAQVNDTILSVLEIEDHNQVLIDETRKKILSDFDATLPRNKEYRRSLDWAAICDIWQKFKYLDHYKPKEDSSIYNYTLKLPPGSTYIFGRSLTALPVPFYFPAPNYYNLVFKARFVSNYRFSLFLVPVSITGTGYVYLNGERLRIEDCQANFLQEQRSLVDDIFIEEAKNLEVSFMVNSYVFNLFYPDSVQYRFRVEGNNLAGLKVTSQ